MGRINYQIPDELHKALKHKALEKDTTLIGLIIRYLTEGLARDTK